MRGLAWWGWGLEEEEERVRHVEQTRKLSRANKAAPYLFLPPNWKLGRVLVPQPPRALGPGAK